MNALTEFAAAGRSSLAKFEALAADPGNPEDDASWKGNPAYILGLRKPVIAAVNGACAGMGFSYATFCDMRFMEQGARIVTSFAPRGLVAEHGTSWLLPRLVGPSNALDLFWSSRRVEADEAHRMGWANRLCAPGTAASEAQAYLRGLAGTSAPVSIMLMKRQVWKHLMRDLAEANPETNHLIAESLKRNDFKEGVASFVEKRAPNFAKIRLD
jgi:enoyl-CoA hydratase/carnithine racemase